MQSLFGPVMQNAFVVPDLGAAMDHWTRVMGVGPFFLLEHIAFAECRFRGKPTDIDISVGIAYWGDVQIELIEQHNDAPSIYTEFLGRGFQGMQHMGVITRSVEDDLARIAPLGIEPVQEGRTALGIRFAYVATDFHPGGMIELIEGKRGVLAFFESMRESARNWDGSDPVRRTG